MTDAIQVITTVSEQADARRLAAVLVERRLAACVQISGPIESHYRWQGRLETAAEWVCTIKTRGGLYGEVERTVRELHPYQEPEILAVPIVAGSEGYLRWLANECSRETE